MEPRQVRETGSADVGARYVSDSTSQLKERRHQRNPVAENESVQTLVYSTTA